MIGYRCNCMFSCGGPSTRTSRVSVAGDARLPPTIVHDETPISVYIRRIYDKLLAEPRISFASIFTAGMPKSTLIGMFLALLEVVRHYDVSVEQPGMHGEIWIVETKSCLQDFAVDDKWPDYVDYCDRFFFGVTEAFPHDLIPEDVGLIVADGFGGAILRDSLARNLAGARRKAVTLLFARLAAQRLTPY